MTTRTYHAWMTCISPQAPSPTSRPDTGQYIRRCGPRWSALFMASLCLSVVGCETLPDDTAPTLAPVEIPLSTPTESPITPTEAPIVSTQVPDRDGDGSPAGEDCEDDDAAIYPSAPEVAYDGIDQDCSGADLTDVDGDGFDGPWAPDCNDQNAQVYPGATETVNHQDDDCDGIGDNGTVAYDDDRDGFSENQGDCNDADPTQAPGKPEVAYDQIDQNCDGVDLKDVDQDGFDGGSSGSDCDDAQASVSPAAIEICNSKDDDCDGAVDESSGTVLYADADADGYGDVNSPLSDCGTQSAALNAGDCNDSLATIHPEAPEQCDGIDNDCDGSLDEDAGTLYYQDLDGDHQGDAQKPVQACVMPPDAVTNSADCDDLDSDVFAGAAEQCDGIDNDCDDQIDEDLSRTYYPDADNDAYGSPKDPIETCYIPKGYANNFADCNDNDPLIKPGAIESCNGVDDDCDGMMDDGFVAQTYYQDQDLDGYGNANAKISACTLPEGYAATSGDCHDQDASVHPAMVESCNGRDDNCNGLADEDVLTTYYLDQDGDGVGVQSSSIAACSAPSGYVSQSGDCDDENASVSPKTAEVANLADDNCDGSVDEGVYFMSCQDLLMANPQAASGPYSLDVDGAGPLPPRTAYCDMQTDGGGWTLCASLGHQKYGDGLHYTTDVWGNSANAFLENGRVMAYGNFCSEMDMEALYGEARDSAEVLYFKTGPVDTLGENPFASEGYFAYGNAQQDTIAFYNRSQVQPRGAYFMNSGCDTATGLNSQGTDLCVSEGQKWQSMMGDQNGNEAANDWMNARSSALGSDVDNVILFFVR